MSFYDAEYLHEYCILLTMNFYPSLGPITPQGAGMLAVQTMAGNTVRSFSRCEKPESVPIDSYGKVSILINQYSVTMSDNSSVSSKCDTSCSFLLQANFRICATGVVLELDKSLTIVKKLKLTGTPTKIYKKTAFVEVSFDGN